MTLELYWLENSPYYDPRVVIYTRQMFIRLANGHEIEFPPHHLNEHSSSENLTCVNYVGIVNIKWAGI